MPPPRSLLALRPAFAAAVLALLVPTLPGCSTRSSSYTVPADRDRLTREEMAGTNNQTVYEAVEELRPEWLTARGSVSATDPTPARANVYMNGTRMGGVDYLRGVAILDVEYVRFWEAGEAGVRFGMGNPRGVIEIIPHR